MAKGSKKTQTQGVIKLSMNSTVEEFCQKCANDKSFQNRCRTIRDKRGDAGMSWPRQVDFVLTILLSFPDDTSVSNLKTQLSKITQQQPAAITQPMCSFLGKPSKKKSKDNQNFEYIYWNTNSDLWKQSGSSYLKDQENILSEAKPGNCITGLPEPMVLAEIQEFYKSLKKTTHPNPRLQDVVDALTIDELDAAEDATPSQKEKSEAQQKSYPNLCLDKERAQKFEITLNALINASPSETVIDLIARGGCRQIVFTGAPGTGKTFIAKDITQHFLGLHQSASLLSSASNKKSKPYVQVQFHPSYDYTDFVEGLRPLKTGAFGKVDGTFKEFCRRVVAANKETLEKYTLAQNILKEPADADNQAALNLLFSNSIAHALKGGESFATLSEKIENLQSDSTTEDSSDDTQDLLTDLTNILFCGNMSKETSVSSTQTENTAQLLSTINEELQTKILRTYVDQVTASFDSSGKRDEDSLLYPLYFFIIDEINRANLSKVFGELMYCLEKNKRGKDNAIQTQYQNLPTHLPDGTPLKPAEDVFFEDFYIPKNVVVIGTMNDIDRSVDSMDFALRRRFDWVEFEVDQASLSRAFSSPNYSELIRDNATPLASAIMNLNNYLGTEGANHGLNRQYYIGQGQFADLPEYLTNDSGGKKGADAITPILEYVWEYRLSSLLREYLRGMDEATISTFLDTARKKLMSSK